MSSIRQFGYLAAYNGDSKHGFARQFDQQISVSFDVINYDPDADFKVIVQCEPPHLYLRFPGMVKTIADQVDLILTYNSELLELPNAEEFCPVGSWISDDIVLDKTDQISYLMSSKVFTPDQRMRFIIMRRFSHLTRLGQFEFNMHRSPPRAPTKDAFFTRAKFNIACENQYYPNMFTEKLLDCFKTRTVPIYFGCPNLSNYFDIRGVLMFKSIEELEDIVQNLTPADYDRMLPYIEENYQRGRVYWEKSVYQRIEDIIATRLENVNIY
jgi:hypothetical protein